MSLRRYSYLCLYGHMFGVRPYIMHFRDYMSIEYFLIKQVRLEVFVQLLRY